MATVKDFILKQGLVANTTITVNGVNVLANDYATYLTAKANDYNTYTTLVGFINNVQNNVGAGASGYEANDYNTYTTLQGEYRANDYNTYTTLSANDGATLLSARANDYSTYTALQGELAANDYSTYTTLQGEFAANDYSTYLQAQANDYSTYTNLQGEFAANDYSTYTALQGEFAANDYATFLSASANDYNTYTALQGELAANDYATFLAASSNDYATFLAASANDYSTYTNLQGEFAANDYATLLAAQANDYSTYTALQGEFAANDYATYLQAQSNDGATLLSARANDYTTLLSAQANDFNSYTTLVGFINTVQDNVTSGGDASNTFVNANDYNTYATLVNEYQGNDFATYTTLLNGYRANDYNTYTGIIAFANLKANASVNIVAGDGLTGGGDLTSNVNISVDSSVVRTSGNQTINGTKTFGDDVVIEGGLTVNGNVTVVSTTNLVVDDRFIELGANTSGLPSADTGIYFNRGASGNSVFYYNESQGWFALADTFDPSTNVTVSPVNYAWLKLDTLLLSNTATVTNLNADLLDGEQGSYYLDFANASNTNYITLAYVTANGATTTESIAVGGLDVDSGTLYVDSTNNYVGVQTVTPGAMLQVKDAGIHTATLTTTATTADQVVDSWSATTYRTAKYLIQIHDTGNNDYQTSELLLIHDGVTAYLTEYAIVYSDASLASFNADISGGNVRLLVTPVNTDNDITVVRTTLIA
jgi:hypothetical protein